MREVIKFLLVGSFCGFGEGVEMGVCVCVCGGS